MRRHVVALAFDKDAAPGQRFVTPLAVLVQGLVARLRQLDAAGLARALHSAGGVDGVAEQLVPATLAKEADSHLADDHTRADTPRR